ncbi:ATP-dependent DNA helicase [Mycoplasma enhydrae]|uniref:ATP-dependent DNA helicase n=1 Tax=Mycoplasma enhydrae TaxID=2499220 RepID=UPI00197C777F|nr:AAA family ATPase [Mycoplasma enhydrae]MBN4089371.1 AAA family ATPase [Mycoplasma enhydrae]
MENQIYLVTGKFTRILWQSQKGDVVIAAFNVIKNDEKNPIQLNKYNSISIILRDNIFKTLKLTLNDESYEFKVIKNENSKYPDSYNLDYATPILLAKKEESKNDFSYLTKVLRLPMFKGILDSKANLLVSELGENIFSSILDSKNLVQPNNYGIAEEDWIIIKKTIADNIDFLNSISQLFKINVSLQFHKKISKKFSTFEEFLEEYKQNPYQYYFDAEEENKPRLSDIDKIVLHFSPEASKYKSSTYLYSFVQQYFFGSGNTRILESELFKTISTFTFDNNLERDENLFNLAKEELLEQRYLIHLNYENEVFITTRDSIYMEQYVIKRLGHINDLNISFDIKYSPSMNFHKTQLEAIEAALNEKLVLITGNPGTGKTLITNEIINTLLQKYHKNDIAILTPTGRATININAKQNNTKAQTIHSLLQWDPENNKFYVNDKNPISVECLIIDEFSMVPLELFYSLLRGITRKSLKKIILVGDKDQLPAIGSGYLIKDFIESNIFKTIALTKIYRQADNFEIIRDALKINESKMPLFEDANSQMIECKRANLQEYLINKIEELRAQGYSKKEIAVLSPMYKYDTGIDELNVALNNYYRSLEQAEVIKYKEHSFAIGDKVINLINDSKNKVFNGEIGYISRFTFAKSNSTKDKKLTHITVDFENDEKSVVYSRADFLENTYPAYCTSVHKYQGSECKAVIVVLFSEAKKLLSKKLIYTAITRAKQYSVIIGEKSALKYGIEKDDDSNRITNIKYLWQKRK